MSKLIPLFVVCLYLCGCNARTATLTKANGKIDPCTLLTKEDAAAALDGNVEVAPTADSRGCSFNLAPTGSTTDKRYASIALVVVTPDSPDFQKFGSTSERNFVKSVSGIGDKAILYGNKEYPDISPKGMHVLKGNLYIGIAMSTSTPPVSEDVLKSLAVKAVSRLP